MPLCESCKRKRRIHNNQIFFQNLAKISKKAKALSSRSTIGLAKKEASYDTYPAGSITLEMVVILPMFVTFMVFFLFLFRVMLVQEGVEEALLYASRTMAADCYAESPEEPQTQGKLLAGAEGLFLQCLKDNGCPTRFVRGGAAGISLMGSELAGDEIELRADYDMRFPCVLIGDFTYHIAQSSISRKWIGDISLVGGSPGGEDAWVYITPRGSAYHLTTECSYLDLSIRAVSRRSLRTLRSANGSIYHACESCGSGGGGTVFITDYGERYHTSLACSGLKRTIYMVRLSEVGGRHLCAKCAAAR